MLFNIPTQTLILQFYQSFINIYSFQWKLANKNQKNAKIKHPIQIRKKLGISVGAFNLWWRHQKNNDLANFWQFSKQWHFVHKRWMTCWQKQQTSTIRQSREQRGEGNLPAPLPHHDYEGQKYPMTNRVNCPCKGLSWKWSIARWVKISRGVSCFQIRWEPR